MDSIIRKTEINLSTVGNGVILFGIWTLVKFLLTAVFTAENSDEKAALFSLSAWILTIAEFALRCYIGFSARAEGKGKQKRVVYLVFTAFLIFIYLPIIILEIFMLFILPDYIFNLIITLIIDVTSVTFLFELMINSIRLRKLRKLQSENGGQP